MTYWQNGHMGGSGAFPMMLAALAIWALVAAVWATRPSRALTAPMPVPIATAHDAALGTEPALVGHLIPGRGSHDDYWPRLEALSHRNAS